MDYLDEDQTISNQKFAVLSYVLSDESPEVKVRSSYGSTGESRTGSPMIKIRGSYGSIEECESRIKRLQVADKFFDMYVVEIGKWGSLLSKKQFEDGKYDEVYRNEQMNSMIKDYKEQKIKADEVFEKRKIDMIQKAKEDGTSEGQAILAAQKEHPLSVKKRMDDSAEFMVQLESQLKECRDIHNLAVAKWSEYTEDEIKDIDVKGKGVKFTG